MRSSILLLLFLFGVCISNAQEYYYYNGEKIAIERNEKNLYLSSSNKDCIQKLSDKFGLNYYEFNELRFNRNCQIGKQTIRFESFVNIEQTAISQLEDIQKDPQTIVAYSYIVNEDTVYSTIYFYVCLYSIEDFYILQQYSKENNVRIVSQDKYMPEWYTLAVIENSPINAIEAANRFYESGYFKYSEPDWRKNNLRQSNDTYYSQQWGLKNMGQHNGIYGMDISTESAWNISKGDDIIVAVIDHGIQLDHPDLSINIYPISYDADNDTLGSIIHTSHGTSCAGIIGAIQNNGIGITGVAPQCKLMSISLSLTPSTPKVCFVNAINWAWINGADVLNNSYSEVPFSNYINDAINSAIINGRNGLGSPVLFSTGNALPNINDAYVRYPASLSSTIAVGAMSPCGERKNLNSCDGRTWKSCYGTELDVVAPGVLIPTTTINSSYDTAFGGTSAACPHAAGVMALILSVNPCLTATEARAILCKSCDKLSDYKYCNSTYGFWNQEVGYGKINAYKAVLMALGLVYENQVTGIVGQPTSFNWLLSQSGCTGLTNVSYSVQRYEVTKTITFPYTENPIIHVSTNGFSAANPNQGNNYYTITNITHTSADVKTWKYKIITNNGGQTFLPSGDVWFKYIVYDDTAPTVYISNKTVNNTTYNRTAIEKLVMTNFTVQGNSNVELRAGEEIIFNAETSIKPTSTGIVQANAESFVSCENNRAIQNDSSNMLVNEAVVLKAFNDEDVTEFSNKIEKDIIPVVLFPNPAKDEIIVRFNKEIGDKGLTITVNNSSGNKIEEITSTDKETSLNVLQYSNGVYIITVKNNEDVYKKTFIKK